MDQVKAEIELCESPAVLDLEEVDLVDIDGVRFLNECEAEGISVVAVFAIHQGMDAAGAKSNKSAP